ncbi:MAG: nitrilase [Firmicutes bacterium]|nr:nitrilase [Bacillota bacterium]
MGSTRKAADWLKERAFNYLLLWKSGPRRVKRVLDSRRIGRSSNCNHLPARRIRVASVQMRLELVGSATQYAEKIYRLTREAVERGAQLIVFPEYTGIPLVGFLPGLEKLAAGTTMQGALDTMVGGDVKAADVFRVLAPAVRRIYETTFAELSRRFGVYIIAGSAVLPDETGEVRNYGHFFGPDGLLIGRQAKVHLMPEEAAWGLSPGEGFQVFDTLLGRIALPVCMDATYFETFWIVAQAGAEMVAIPSANPEPYNLWMALRGIWPRVQESQVIGIGSSMVGEFMGLAFTGRSSVLAPLELTPDRTGVIAQAATFDQEEVVVADVDLGALAQLRQEAPISGGFNIALYKKYLPMAYLKHGRP